jgi:DNA invertase Pin-like site-specific DNA recombinase
MIGFLNLVNGDIVMTARTGRDKINEKEIKRIHELIKLGLSIAEIAKRFNCSLNPIRKIKKEMK